MALSASCVMEWNISLAIFLATKSVLCLEAIFSILWSAGKCWMEEDNSHFCSVHWPSSISAQPRRIHVCCCYRAGLLGQEPLGESGILTLAQPRWAYLKSCAATELGTLACLPVDFAPGQARDMSSSKRRCDEIVKLRSLEQVSVCSFSQSLRRRKALG